MNSEAAAINALCETLLNGLQHQFSYLLDSMNPCIKLTFDDKKFSSTVAKQHIRSYLLTCISGSTTQTTPVAVERKKRLLEYSFYSQCESTTTTNCADVELQTYLE